jgi:anti-anti-sigma factor
VTSHELTVERSTDTGAGAMVFRLSGVLGETDVCFQLLDEIRRDIGTMPGRIVMNVKNVERVTSPGIGVIAACYTTAKNSGRAFVLASPPKQMRQVLEVCGLHGVIPQFASEKDALEAK